jgi:Predicted inhibitor of MCP methylation, homolog of CheC
MEHKYADIFIDAWNTVFESFSSKHIMRASVESPKDASARDISVLIGFIGDVDGQIFMSMDAKMGKAIASEMLGGMEINEVDEVVFSAVGELCNMVMGNACSSISQETANVDITTPTVLHDDMPKLRLKPLYNISFLFDDMESIDFNVAVLIA